MTVTTRTTVDSDGGVRHILEYNGGIEYDKVTVRFSPDDTEPITCTCLKDGEVVYQNAFETRAVSFAPISVIGRGESDRLQGVSSNMTSGDVPADVTTAFQTLGFTVVPQGEWWIDE